MNWHQKTLETYNKSAVQLADYFQGIGSRVADIERGLNLAGNPKNPKIVEIGCGDGRDAVEIIKRAGWYQGFDPSTELLKIAQKNAPDGSFVIADALSYEYPKQLDVVYAFASLLHLNKYDFGRVLDNLAESLKTGGIFYISLKERTEYGREVKRDTYGERMFYFYNAEIIRDMTRDSGVYEVVYEDSHVHGKTDWLTIALKKI